MGYFKDLHCDLLDLYSKAEQNYLLFKGFIEKDGFCESNAIAMAQFYGQMCGYMNAEKAIFQSNAIEDEMKELGEIKLFRTDFEKISS